MEEPQGGAYSQNPIFLASQKRLMQRGVVGEEEATVLGGIGSALKAIPRGAVEAVGGMAAGAARGGLAMQPYIAPVHVALGFPDPNDVITQVNAKIAEFARNTFPSTESIERAGGAAKFFAQDLPEFAGAAIPFIAGGWAAKAAGAPALVAEKVTPMLLGALASGNAGWEDAKRSGADDATAWTSFAANAGVGAVAMRYGAVPKILERANRSSGGMFLRALQNAGVTAGQTFAADAIAEQLYTDEDRISVQRMLEQGALGGLTAVFLEGLDRSYTKLRSPPEPPKVAQIPAETPRAPVPPAKPVPGKMAPAQPAATAAPAPAAPAKPGAPEPPKPAAATAPPAQPTAKPPPPEPVKPGPGGQVPDPDIVKPAPPAPALVPEIVPKGQPIPGDQPKAPEHVPGREAAQQEVDYTGVEIPNQTSDFEAGWYPETQSFEPPPNKQLVGHPQTEPTELELPDGKTMRAEYAVVEASTLQPSHDPVTFKLNPLGDKNERPYEHATEGLPLREGVRQRAENLKPKILLSDSPTVTDGPPIVKKDGTVLGGNGRSMSMILAYRSGKALEYQKAVLEWAAKRGMDVTTLKEPVLVRIVADADAGKRGELSRLLNESLTLGKTPATEAVSRGSKIDAKAAQEIAALMGPDGSVREVLTNPATVNAVLSELVRSGAFSQKDVVGYMQDGKLTEAGKQLIEDALMGAAVPDVYALRGASPELRNGLMYALSPVVRARGLYPELGQTLLHAIEATIDAKRNRMTIEEAVMQSTIESLPWKADKEAVGLAKAMDGLGKKQTKALWMDLAESLGSWKNGQATLEGPPPVSAKAAIWQVLHGRGIQGHVTEPPPGDASPNDGQIPDFLGRPGAHIDATDMDVGLEGSDQPADPVLGGPSEEVLELQLNDELAKPKDPFSKGAIGQPIGYRDMTGELSSFGADWDTVHLPHRQQIVKEYAKLLQVMGLTGAIFRTRRTGQGAEAKNILGLFKIRSAVLRLQRDGDISTAPHEFAHALEKALFGIDMRKGNPFGSNATKDLPFQNAKLLQELEKFGMALYGVDCPPHLVLREGWAEFWREWFNEPESIAKKAPELTAWVEGPDIFGKWPELAEGAEKVRGIVDAWRRGGGYLRVAAQIKNPAAWSEKKQDLINKVRAWSAADSFIDVAWDLFDFQERATKQLAGKAREGSKVEPGLRLPARKLRPGERGPMPIRRGIQAGERAADLLDSLRMASGPMGRHFIEKYTMDSLGNKTGMSLVDALEPAKEAGHEALSVYLVAKRAISLWTDPLGQRDPGISIQDARAALEDLRLQLNPRAFAGLELAQKNYETWWKNVNRYCSQMSETYALDWKNLRRIDIQRRQMTDGEWEPFYAPLKAADLNEYGQVLRGYSQGGRNIEVGVFRKLKGSGKRKIDPVQGAAYEMERRVQAAHSWAVIDAARRLEKVTEDAGDLLIKVPPEFFKSHAPSYNELLDRVEKSINEAQAAAGGEAVDIRQLLEDNGVTPDVIEEGLGERLALFSEKPPGPNGLPTVGIWNAETRKVEYFEMTTGMQKALTGMNPYRLKGGLAFLEHGLFQVPKQVFTMGTTGMRLTFSYITNPARDIQTLYLNTASGKSARELAWIWAKTMRSALSASLTGKHDNWAMDMIHKFGVSMNTPLAQDTAFVEASLDKMFGEKDMFHRAQAGWNWTKEFMQIPELVTRATEIQAVASKRGWEPGMPMDETLAMDLINAARRVSTNFAAAGEVARAFNRVAPFFNASIQGPYASWKAAKRNPAGFMMRGLSIAASSAALWMLIKDQDWYKELSPREKYTYWHVPAKMFGQKVVWRVPMSHEIGTIFGAMPMAMLDALHEQDPRAAMDWASVAAQQTLPNVMPVLLGEALEQASNRDFFSGMPIVPRGQEEAPAGEQFGDYTTRASLQLGRMFGWSPRRVDHIIRGTAGSAALDILALGGRGTDNKRAYISEPSDVPAVGVLFQRGGQAGTQPRSVTDVYDVYGEFYGRSRSTRNPETEENRQRRLMLQNATQAISALTWIRSRTSDANARAKLTQESIDIAKDALKRVHGTDIYDRGDLRWKSKQYENLKDQMAKHPEWVDRKGM